LEQVKIVLRYLDGRIVKGYTQDYTPSKTFFHLRTDAPGGVDQTIDLRMEELKALFFVRSVEGNRDYPERKKFAEGERPPGRKAEVTFVDGEAMQGWTMGHDPRHAGFFLCPPDPQSNNILIFAVSAAVKHFRYL
jgi:hypothetical protein